MEIRNLAIIAHVDHGKTTLVDKLLKVTRTNLRLEIEERAMDSNDLEKEKGITILAKNTAIYWGDVKINILDTPGHADFGGEVERILSMVDGVLLLVDAFEGVMPQTKFVLRKALEAGVQPIVVINKIDRPSADAGRSENQIFDLFIELGATEEQLNYKTVYCSALLGVAGYTKDNVKDETMAPILDTIIKEIKPPKSDDTAPLLFQPCLIDYNEYVGRIGIGKIYQGTISTNLAVSLIRLNDTVESYRIQKIYQYIGLAKEVVETAISGDIVGIAGIETIMVGETITLPGCKEKLKPIKIDEPTIKMNFLPNDSPFAGQEGKYVTSTKLEERLLKQTFKDVSLKVERVETKDVWIVSGRGELHLSILIETMRREGYEFAVSKPQVILKRIDGTLYEPWEEVIIDIPSLYIGDIIEFFGNRNGNLIDMNNTGLNTRIIYEMPAKSLIGIHSSFLTLTKGYGIMNHSFSKFLPNSSGTTIEKTVGSLICSNTSKTTAYALHHLEDRGTMFVEPGTNVYEGMIIGKNNTGRDLIINVTEEKKMTNQRSSSKDNTVVLRKPQTMSLEDYLSFISDDEILEITPKNIRCRKYYLSEIERRRHSKSTNIA